MCSDLKRPHPAGRAAVATVLLAAVPVLLAGCGKSGPPEPPFRAVPAPTKDLAVRQRGTHIVLAFRYPDTAPGGQALGGVSKVEVYEADIPPPEAPGASKKKKPATPAGKGAPAAAGTKSGTAASTATGTPAAGTGAGTTAAGGGTGAAAGATGTAAGTTGTTGTATGGAGTAGATAGTTSGTGTAAGSTGTATGTTGTAAATPSIIAPEPLETPMLAKLAKLKLTLGSKDLASATVGNFLVIDLPLTETLPAETTPEQVTRDYAVRTFGPKGDRSEFSNQVLLKVKVPPHAPEGVTATGQADGVMVAWKAVTGAGTYAVYRRAASERFSVKPLATVPSSETEYLDQKAAFGQDYIYSVTAVDSKEPLVESAMQSEIEVHYVDRFPPPVPGDLVAVAEIGKARLVWRQSEASDLAGYIVYRKAPGGDFVRLTEKPIGRTTYVDETAASGKTYVYRVTAIDQVGNESAPSGEVSVAIP